MEKSYLNELSEWLDSHPKKKEGLNKSGKIAFLTVKDDVKTALDAGYPMSVVWEHMSDSGKLKCSYKTFFRHVHRYIRQPADEAKVVDSSPPKEKPAAEKTPEVKTAKGDDSEDSEKAERLPWEKKLKVAKEKIAAMKNKTPQDRIDPKPIPENDKALAKEEILPVAKSDGQEQEKKTERPVDPWAGRKKMMREIREKYKIK